LSSRATAIANRTPGHRWGRSPGSITCDPLPWKLRSRCSARNWLPVCHQHGSLEWPQLLAALAAGFYQQARLTVLADQEEIRRAVVAERDALATAHRASEARYRTIFEQAALGIALFAADSRLLETNPALDGMLGYTGDELRRLSFTAITHPDDVAATLQLYQELVAGPRDVAQMEKRYLRRDGVVVWARLTASLVRAAADAKRGS